MALPPGLPVRRAALRLLDAVFRRGETLEQAEGAGLADIRKAPDRALAKAIAGETLRWLTDLDALIDSATKQALPHDAKARMVLRLMLAQALRLETPPHAVIATGLPLLAGGPRRLAHGVFSALVKQGAALPEVPTLPAAVAARWGADKSAEIAPGLAFPPELDLSLKDAAETQTRAVAMGGISLAPAHIRLPRGAAVESLADFKAGDWWVQDLAAQIPARLLGAGEGRSALDLCAAPGGKTMQLAANGWKVTALDMSKRRLDLLKDNLKRTGLKASPVRADALTWEPKHRFDAILIDAPCTATGTCRRHPDVLHRIGKGQVAEMVELQRALAAKAAEWLNPGGVLVYAVCSLEAEEGEEQAAWIDAELGLTREPITPEELPAGLTPTPDGALRTHPGMLADAGGLDGFFVARWVNS
ncbi:MAG: RsmB/NOP family class I SAM-dependent RNA methyltransferase [Erythrobacter sp.]|jgi:16S rRNA (cytosine967-C5)-methyltransferase|uniref:RsmB/NOP family class I SAM-dependent RNA methyltransferase n=1 Tax=Erythrobacter sp. TaxID=1042 RepID=UPI002B48EBD8|nr:RsmB/NOP family class I SAM-dependent RNA methyltransferase [Erythrobacter sp.]WRH69915.1 MAG: RsmB/NOP family class I SAM-dependent RNA methyltransferase [Erythrobacter sp.]